MAAVRSAGEPREESEDEGEEEVRTMVARARATAEDDEARGPGEEWDDGGGGRRPSGKRSSELPSRGARV